jgi:hypothetical protein
VGDIFCKLADKEGVMDTIPLDQFLADSGAILDRVKRTGNPIMIIENGEGRAEIHPPSISGRPPRVLGGMRDQVQIFGDVVSPASEESDWEVLGF